MKPHEIFDPLVVEHDRNLLVLLDRIHGQQIFQTGELPLLILA